MRAAVAALFIGALFVLSGCQYLFGMGIPPGPAVFPGGSLRPGRLRLLRSERTRLLDAAAPGDLHERFGHGHDRWRAGDPRQAHWNGRHVRGFRHRGDLDRRQRPVPPVQRPAVPLAQQGGVYLEIHRIRDGEHWTSSDPTRRRSMVSKQDASGLAGSATCKGLRWMDAMSFASLVPGPIGTSRLRRGPRVPGGALAKAVATEPAPPSAVRSRGARSPPLPRHVCAPRISAAAPAAGGVQIPTPRVLGHDVSQIGGPGRRIHASSGPRPGSNASNRGGEDAQDPPQEYLSRTTTLGRSPPDPAASDGSSVDHPEEPRAASPDAPRRVAGSFARPR